MKELSETKKTAMKMMNSAQYLEEAFIATMRGLIILVIQMAKRGTLKVFSSKIVCLFQISKVISLQDG